MAKLAFHLLLVFALLVGGAPNYLVHSHQDDALHHMHETGHGAFASHADHHHSQLAFAVELALDMNDPTGSESADTSLLHVHAVPVQAAVVPAGLVVPFLMHSGNYACRSPSPCHLRAWVLPELRPPIA